MNKTQVIKILKVTIIATIIMLISEIFFSFPQINNWFAGVIYSSTGILTYIIIWVIMFLQVTVLNIPAYVILMASYKIGLNTLGIPYLLVVITAYMAGCICAYFIGNKWGIKAVKWCAGSEEDYNKWSEILNKKGKWWYLLTVVFPLFPDDLLCIVAGSINFDIKFYLLANLIGRSVGLITMLYTIKLIGVIGGGFPFMIIVWAVALIAQFITMKVLEKKNEKI